jgi:MFS family permease
MYAVLHNRNYAFLWIGGFISNLGDWVLRGALPFYVYTRTGSALATGLTFMASVLPWVILSSVAGVFVDHWNLKRTMIIADLARAALMLLLLLMVVVPSLFWLVYFVSFVEACITQFFNPASIALVPQVVGKDYLQEANALNSFSGSLSRLIGPLLGGVLLTVVGSASTIIADGVSYVSSALMITLVLVPFSLPEKSREHMESESMTKRVSYWRDWLHGLICLTTKLFFVRRRAWG